MSFCTAINCVDGRTQLPVNDYLCDRLGVEHVDTVTEPGPVKILAEQTDWPLAQSILSRVDVSVNEHGSEAIAVVAHHDCAGNPTTEDIQKQQLQVSAEFLSQHYPDLRILTLWVGPDWLVQDIPLLDP